MFKKIFYLVTIIFCTGIQAQQINSLVVSKKIAFSNDTIQLEKTSINQNFFKLLEANDIEIDSSFYEINYQKAFVLFKENYVKTSDSIKIKYQKFPEFLTQFYSIYNSDRLVPNEIGRAHV